MDDTNNQQGNAPFMPVAPAAPTVQTNDAMSMGGMPPMPPAEQTPIPQQVTFPAGNLSDLAGMTPPPMPMAPVAPVAPMASPMPAQQIPSYMDAPAQTSNPMPATDAAMTMPIKDSPSRSNATPNQDDYSYAEDILDEILDSLDRIEAKLEALEKKVG